ncbi:MAG: phospho-N-acetylmuramoyl-pentapeptide-transferase [Elusimicrobia bacterium]|nr:phospho-N-acetylmuramoyl-pentapeptide-transferase [Elusimicrobiota bacterium]MBU2615332.1 phospho-N-acetylmuramoyl-pentapeptide-transferase [Elusimicrobiota bacterium]
MLYHLLYPLKIYFSPLNVLEYITFRSISAIITSLLISFIFGPKIINYLKNKQFLQSIRTDGPQTHLKKNGTPTMGGLIILISLVVSTILWAKLDNRFILWIIAGMVWFGLLGYMDDYTKIVRKDSKGLIARWKLAGQFTFAAAVCIYLYFYPANYQYATSINIPYLKEVFIDLRIFYLLFAMVVIVGASNAVNLTDGLDGLAIGNIIIAGIAYAIFAYIAGNAKMSQYLRIIPVSGAGELTVFLCAMIGSGLGFLWFNGYPAEVFMGDTGSLFLGGAIGLVAVFIKQELIFIVVCGVFFAEIISVVLQVFSYKRYKKRIFKMAPLHHHFELSGWVETKVTVRFWIAGIILMLIAMSSLKLR